MPTRKSQNNTSFKKSTGDTDYKAQYQKNSVSTLKALVRKLERNEFEVVSFGWWPEATPNKFTFQIHVKESES